MKTLNVAMISLMTPAFAFAQYDPATPFPGGGPGMEPSYNPNQTAYQSGASVDSGAGIIVIGIIIYFLFFKKKGGGTS